MPIPNELRRSAYSTPTEDRTQSSTRQAAIERNVRADNSGLRDMYLTFLKGVGENAITLNTMKNSSEMAIRKHIDSKYKAQFQEWVTNGQKFKTTPTIRQNQNTPQQDERRRNRQQIARQVNQAINASAMRSTPGMSDEFAMQNPEAVETAARTNMVTQTLPLTISGGIGALQIPEFQGALNLWGSYEGAKSFFGPEGYQKTIDLWNQGKYGQSLLSGTGDAINATLSALPFTRVVPAAARGYNVAKEFVSPTIASRFTPQGLRIGNNAYRLSYTPQGTMSFGGLGELSGVKLNKTPIQSWSLEALPGYQIKSLFTGSPLEKQLSKQGTLSLKQLQAYIGRNDVSAIDKELLNRVLQNHANDTHIDYNTLRREVQEMIPQYSRVPQTGYQEYGIDRLKYFANSYFFEQMFEAQLMHMPGYRPVYGFRLRSNPESNLMSRRQALQYFNDHKQDFKFDDVKLNTFTFESPGIAGNAKHYDQHTLGHSRTYTTADEPDVLHVMESQSDWAQSGGTSNAVGKRRVEQALNFAKRDLEQGNYGFGTKEELEQKIVNLTKQLQSFELDPVQSYMTKSYLNRQLQENLKYAAERGQTKMRYPTSETAAKIEGYQKDWRVEVPFTQEELAYFQNNEFLRNQEEIRLYRDAYNTAFQTYLRRFPNDAEIQDFYKYMQSEYQKNPSKVFFEGDPHIPNSLESNETLHQILEGYVSEADVNFEKFKNAHPVTSKPKFDVTYRPEHQTILKKYSDFPKQYQKLFGKQSQVRTVTDAKGNTWYEVDVPQNYLDGTAEMLFRNGGTLNPVQRFKKYRK